MNVYFPTPLKAVNKDGAPTRHITFTAHPPIDCIFTGRLMYQDRAEPSSTMIQL